MARRQIGQEVFAFVADSTPHRSSLDQLSGLIDWSSLDRHLADIYAAANYGLQRMRWRGLAKAALQVRLTAVADNPKRAVVILRPETA